MPTLTLKEFTFHELFDPKALTRLDERFLAFALERDENLHQFIQDYRHKSTALLNIDTSEALISLADLLAAFIAELFDIKTACHRLQLATCQYDPIFSFKKSYVLNFAKRRLKKDETLPEFSELTNWLYSKISNDADIELNVANFANQALIDADADTIEKLTTWCIHILREMPAPFNSWVSFKLPKRLDYQQLVTRKKIKLMPRDGFGLTDHRMSAKEVANEIHYCVYCHTKEDDFCSKGFPKKKKAPELGFKQNPLNVTLTGCPLEEKISEMHVLKKQGNTIGALAMVMVDNPMCPATGHRICNDCMKACIYQKQDPVNIPEIETRVLTDVLSLPWGVEIYDLLTRWNPLRQEQYCLKPFNQSSVMIAGMGPAGFTLAHHLTMEGCAVVGIDGLKIEPLESQYLNHPIHDYQSITENLDERVMAGFGGVAEYGITSRWDKNFLKLIYITLMRRKHFQAFGDVRFGGTVTIKDAEQMGFDHLSIAVGAGLPKALPIPGSLAPGMRQANDFLMALQLTGAAKKDSFANLQIRLPILVIGGGLTGVDAATEAQAYYIRQVEKTYERYQAICAKAGESAARQPFSEYDLTILDEQLAHAKAIKAERTLAIAENRSPDFITLIHKWGGVSIVYRRQMQESPAYISNHEELQRALEQGIIYQENIWPKAAILDKHGHVGGLETVIRHHNASGDWTHDADICIPAKTILVATGAKLNIAYSFEHAGELKKENGHYVPHELVDNKLVPVKVAEHCKSDQFGPFTSYQKEHFKVSYIGDSHPVFHGNVVKAIASAKRSYPKIMTSIQKNKREKPAELSHYFNASIQAIDKQNACYIKLIVHCPAACKNAKPGHFFRLQTFEKLSEFPQTESISIAAYQIDHQQQCLHFIIENKGVSTQLLRKLKTNDRISLMGPTGVSSKLSNAHDACLIIGNKLAAIQASVLAQHYQNAHVTFLTNDESAAEIAETFCQDIQITKQADLTAAAAEHQDFFKPFKRVLVIGDQPLLKKFRNFWQNNPDRFTKDVKVFAGVYAPMQCMLKGVCAQCLTWQIDPSNGQRTKAVYACSWQHQPLDIIDINNYFDRLSQNSLQETLGRLISTT